MLRALQMSKALGSGSKLHCLVSVSINSSRQPESRRSFASFSHPQIKTLNTQPKFCNSGLILLNPSALACFSPPTVRFMTSEGSEAKVSVDDLAESIRETISSTASSLPDVLTEPTFHSLGLAHAYPSGWLQAFMEQVHLHSDLPWWGTIIGSK